jgi:hypothetical protein
VQEYPPDDRDDHERGQDWYEEERLQELTAPKPLAEEDGSQQRQDPDRDRATGNEHEGDPQRLPEEPILSKVAVVLEPHPLRGSEQREVRETEVQPAQDRVDTESSEEDHDRQNEDEPPTLAAPDELPSACAMSRSSGSSRQIGGDSGGSRARIRLPPAGVALSAFENGADLAIRVG